MPSTFRLSGVVHRPPPRNPRDGRRRLPTRWERGWRGSLIAAGSFPKEVEYPFPQGRLLPTPSCPTLYPLPTPRRTFGRITVPSFRFLHLDHPFVMSRSHRARSPQTTRVCVSISKVYFAVFTNIFILISWVLKYHFYILATDIGLVVLLCQ